MTLHEIALENRTDKAGHGYCPHYEALLSSYRARPCTLLEIGVSSGESLRMWREWLPQATILGLDKDPGAWRDDGIEVYCGEQDDESVLRQVADKGPFDIIVDDAAHVSREQLPTFRFLWPYVASGGWYVIEDLTCVAEERPNIITVLLENPGITQLLYADCDLREIHLFCDKRGDGIIFLRKR